MSSERKTAGTIDLELIVMTMLLASGTIKLTVLAVFVPIMLYACLLLNFLICAIPSDSN